MVVHQISHKIDAAEYTSRDAMALVIVDRRGDCITSGSVRMMVPEVGEEVAISLAMIAFPKTKGTVSDLNRPHHRSDEAFSLGGAGSI